MDKARQDGSHAPRVRELKRHGRRPPRPLLWSHAPRVRELKPVWRGRSTVEIRSHAPRVRELKLVRRVLRIQQRREAFHDAAAVMEEVVRSGHWGNIDDLTDAQKRLLAEARARRTAERPAETAQDVAQPQATVTGGTPPPEEAGGDDGTVLDYARDAFCYNLPLRKGEMSELAASGELSEKDIYETGYRWDPSIECWRVYPECRASSSRPMVATWGWTGSGTGRRGRGFP